jgi:hypothetical protein
VDVVYAVSDGQVPMADGSLATVRKGGHWPALDPVVKAHPTLFSTDARYGMSYSVEPEGYDAPQVEQATAAPGERRSTRRG